MRKWLLYFSISIIAILALNLLALYLIGFAGGWEIVVLFVIEGFAAIVIVLLQIVTILYLHFSKTIFARFFIAFTSVYSFIFVAIYGLCVWFRYSAVQSMKEVVDLMPSTENLTNYTEMNPYVGKHALFLVPLLFQLAVFTFLRAKTQKLNTILLPE